MAKIRKVFLDNLPKWGSGDGSGHGNEGTINWKKSIGCKVKFIYDDIEGEVEIAECFIKNKRNFLRIKYIDKDTFEISPDSFQRCQLGKLLEKTTNKFKIEIGQTFKDDKRDITIIDREYRPKNNSRGDNQNWRYYKYKCNKCGYDEGWMIEHSLLGQEHGCSVCRGLTVIEGINDVATTNPELVKFFANPEEAKLYSKGSNNMITVICPDCGRVKDNKMAISTIYGMKSIGCKHCGDGYSYGHKYMFNLLTQLKIDFLDNHTLDWCKFYNPFKEKYTCGEYDFVLENENLIIEVDGSFHRNNNNMNGQTKKESMFLDNIKDKLASEYGYNIIRVFYDDNNINIKDGIFDSELTYLFDLSKIDWLKCEEFALSNRAKEVCEIKKNNPEYSTVDIYNITGISTTIVRGYLKKGTILGWCDYDPRKELRKSVSRNGKSKGKSIEVFKDGNSLGIFESASELERRGEELFRVNLNQGKISLVCLGKRNHHKGFTFKYI